MNEKLKIISIDKSFDEAINTAEKIFWNDGVFIYPTDTIYGFGANPFSKAVERITQIKGREEAKKYILLISDIKILKNLIKFENEKYLEFLDSIWPNPISVVLNLNSNTEQKLGPKTAAFRIPNHLFCRELLKKINSPLVSTSVNRSGLIPLTDVKNIVKEFKNEVDAIFNEETSSGLSASTLINLTGTEPVLIRDGNIKFSEIMMRFRAIFKE